MVNAQLKILQVDICEENIAQRGSSMMQTEEERLRRLDRSKCILYVTHRFRRIEIIAVVVKDTVLGKYV